MKFKDNGIYLRKCIDCGLEAHTKFDLENFAKYKKSKYGRMNLCKECSNKRTRVGGIYFKHISEYKKQRHKEINSRRMKFKDKVIYFPYPIRTNICSQCGKSHPKDLTRQTILHHEKYDGANPLKNTLEVCLSCHNIIHNEKRRNNV